MAVQINVQASQTALAQSIAQGVAAFNARYAGQNQLNLQINSRNFSQPLGRITSDLADFESALKASNARVLAFGASTAVLGGVVRSFKEIANVTIEVEKSLTDINRVLNLSTNNLQKFSSELFSISKQTASSFDDATKAALEFSRQGLNTEETLKRTADALTLVRLTGISSTKAVEDLTATINGFSKAGLTTSQVVNKLAAVEQDFAVSASDLTEALSRTGQAAQEAGVSFDELNALVTTAQQNTARGGAVIGNALKTIFTRLQRTETLDQLENFNIAVRDVQGNILPAVQILKNFADQYNNLADAQRAQLSEQVAGVYQVNILKGVIKDLNDNQGTYVQALQRGAMAANEAEIANERLNKTLSALVTQTGIGLQQLANNVGKVTFAPIFEAIVSPVNDAVTYINDTLEGEGIGSVFANGLLKGVRNVIAGPGLAVAFAVIAKVAKNTFEDATKALPAILGLTTEAQKRANIEKSIISILQTQSNLSLALQGQQGNLSSQAATVLNYAKLQTAQYQQQLQIAQQLAPLLAAQNVTVGTRGIQVGPRIKAGGHIPAFAEMSERMGAAMGGYKAGKVVKAPTSVGANTYMNSAEEVKYVSGFAQPFINPPANSKAGRKHRQNAINRTGVDPYMASGFIPNFASSFTDWNWPSGLAEAIMGISKKKTSYTKKNKNDVNPTFAAGRVFENVIAIASKLKEKYSEDYATLDYYPISFGQGLALEKQKLGINEQTLWGDAKLSENDINLDSYISKVIRSGNGTLEKNNAGIWQLKPNVEGGSVLLPKTTSGSDKSILHKTNKQKLIAKNPSIAGKLSNISDNDIISSSLFLDRTEVPLKETFVAEGSTKKDTAEKLASKFNSGGFIPNFAPPISMLRIPWFKKYANSSFDTKQPIFNIAGASSTDTFRSTQFRSSSNDYYKKMGDGNIFGPLYEKFVRSAISLQADKSKIKSIILGQSLEPDTVQGESSFDAFMELVNANPLDALDLVGIEIKGGPKDSQSGGSATGIITKKYNNFATKNPKAAAKLKELLGVFNEPGHPQHLQYMSALGKEFLPLAATNYDEIAKNSPQLVQLLSQKTNELLTSYVNSPNFYKATSSGGFIPNFGSQTISTSFFRTKTGMELFPQGGTGLSGTKYRSEFGNKLDKNSSIYKQFLNNVVMSILGNNVFIPDASAVNEKIFPDKQKTAEDFAKNAALKLSSLGQTTSLGKGNSLSSQFGNRRYVTNPELVSTGKLSGKVRATKYDNLGSVFGKFWSKSPETKAAWEYVQNLVASGKFEDKEKIRPQTSVLRKAYDNWMSQKDYVATIVKLSENRRRAEGVESGVAYASLRSDLSGVSGLEDLASKDYRTKGINYGEYKLNKPKYDKLGRWKYDNLSKRMFLQNQGFIPNFAYKQSVMALEEGMSGKNAILDTTTGPFPFIRNSSQPNFASAISDHGGLKNALNDSMRNQEAVGLMSNGFVPNFATVNAQAGFGLPFGSLKPAEQKLFVEMNKALSQLTRDLTLTSQQQNTLRQTILNNAYALQASTGSTDIVTEANKALTASLQQNANAQQKAAAQATQQQAAQQPVQQTLSTRLLGTSRGGKFDKIFNKLSNNIGFNLAAPLLGGVAESLIAGGDDRSEMGYGRRLASSGASAALSGLSTGAAIGSAIPGIGTAAGAAIGALVGFGGAALNAKNSLEDLQKASENYRNETQTAVESGKGIINIVKSLENLDPNSLEAFDANQKLQEYFVKISETGLDQKFKEAGTDIEKMTKAIKDYETERLAGAKRASEAESRKSKADLSIEQLAKKSGLRTEAVGTTKFRQSRAGAVVSYKTSETEIATTGEAGIANFEKLAVQNSQLFEDVSTIQKAVGEKFPDFVKVIQNEFKSFEFDQDAVKNFLKGYDIQGVDVAAFAETLENINEESGEYGKVVSGNFFEIFKAIEEGKIKTAKDKATSAKSAAERIESVRQRLFKYSQAIEESISKIGIQIENFQFERDFGKLNLEKSAQIINEGLSAISKNIDSAFKNQFDFLVDQTSNLQQKRLLDFEAQNFQKDLAAQAESRRLGRAKELVSVLQTALGETASDQIDTLVSQFRSTGTVDVGSIDIKSFAKGAESKRAVEAFNLTTRLSDEEAKNKEDNARKIFMLEQAYAKQSLKLKEETSKLDYDLSERRYKNTVREKELIDSISNQSKQIQIRGQAQIERSRIEADSPYFMLGQSEFTIADEKRRREAAATRSGFELEARQAIADAEIARIQREVLADNTNATLQNTTAIEALIMSMTSEGNKQFMQQNETVKNLDTQIKAQETFLSLNSMHLPEDIKSAQEKELTDMKARRESIISSSSYAANKASSEIYNRQMETQIARKMLADRKVEGGTFASIDLTTIKDPIKYLNERSIQEKDILESLEGQKNNLLMQKELEGLSLEESAKLKALDDQIAQQRKVVNDVDTANLTIQEKITTEKEKQNRYDKDALKRGTFTTGVAKAVGAIRSETEMFKETLGTTTINAFRDGLVGAMDAALNKADDLESALMGVAAGFLREIQGVMLRNIANQAISSFMPSFSSPASGNQKGGIIRAQKGMYISGGRTGDKNPALLEDGEYVLNRNAVKALGGPRAIDNLNFNAFPRFATGGDPGTMSASADAGAAFERLSMFGREQSPEFQNYMDKIREEEAAKEKKRAERKALLNQFLGTLITTGISMGISSAVSAAKNASQATANLKGAINTDTGVAVSGFSEAKKIVDAGGSITLANGTQVNSSYFGSEAFTRSSFNQLAASRFAASGISGVSKSGFSVQGTVPYGTGKNDFAPINKTFKSPYDAIRYSQSLPSDFKLKSNFIGRRQEGGIIGLNQGGFLPYGSRLTDSIPAYLSGGEYVVNSKAVRKYGVGGMNRINAGIARFQDGGPVQSDTMSPSNTSNSSNSNIAINITVNATNGKSDGEQSDNNGDGTEGNAKELSNRIKSVVLDVITNEQRTGGLLDSTKKK